MGAEPVAGESLEVAIEMVGERCGRGTCVEASGVYGATKHAVNCTNASTRQELENDPIHVTSIMPGVFATNFTRNVDPDLVKGLGIAG